MPIHFSLDRWDRIKEAYRAWWAGELDRPLFYVTLGGADPGRPEPALPRYGFTSFYDMSVPAEAIVDRWDYDLSRREFMGDGFPTVRPVFGPGVMAAFLGARLVNGADTTWFQPVEQQEISEITFEYDPDNVWLHRVLDVTSAAMERWEGRVQVGLTDLGANMDVLSSFRPGQRLLLDLCDYPDDVKRLTWRVHDLWWQYFEEFERVLRPLNPGYSDWTLIYSESPYSMLQCDFCYMIGPDMFDEFVKPELAAMCRQLTNPFYHLDGPGQLPHLDSLLEIDELKGVQWIPGAGAPMAEEWPEVYRKIRDAGKLIQVFDSQFTDGWRGIDILADQLGSAKGIIMIGGGSVSRRDDINALMRKYGAA